MLLQALCIILYPLVNSNLSYSPETANLGQIRWFIESCDLEIWRMTLNKANLRDLIAATGQVIVRRAGLLLSQQDLEWRWSVPLFQCLFSFILFDLCLLITFFNFIMNYVPIVTFWIFTYHKIWILSIMFCFCPACRTTLVATRFRVAVICPIIQVPHCIRVFFYFVWFVFINHIFQFYYELCTYCNILDIYLS